MRVWSEQFCPRNLCDLQPSLRAFKIDMSIPILMYHQIAEPVPPGTPFRGLTVSPKNFARQMRWMRRLGYRGLSMHDLMPYLQGNRIEQGSGIVSGSPVDPGNLSGQGNPHEKVFGITFDDGYRNVYQNALPILQELGFTSTNYFVANQFGGSNVWDAEKGVPTSALMSRQEVLGWARAGQEVGSHTLDHVHLSAVPLDAAREQLTRSRSILSETIDAEVTAFCYPYGDFLLEHRQLAKEAGYLNATTTERGIANVLDDVFALPRVGIWRTTHLLRFLHKCFTQHENRRRD